MLTCADAFIGTHNAGEASVFAATRYWAMDIAGAGDDVGKQVVAYVYCGIGTANPSNGNANWGHMFTLSPAPVGGVYVDLTMAKAKDQ